MRTRMRRCVGRDRQAVATPRRDDEDMVRFAGVNQGVYVATPRRGGRGRAPDGTR